MADIKVKFLIARSIGDTTYDQGSIHEMPRAQAGSLIHSGVVVRATDETEDTAPSDNGRRKTSTKTQDKTEAK